jgi:hypothetical protein
MPKPEEPKPAEPAPMPKPEEPKPAEPAPMPKPEEPKPTEPAPTPKPEAAKPTEPAPTPAAKPVEPAPSAVKPASGPSISFYPPEEALFGPIEPEHRGHVELNLYLGWDLYAPVRGIGVDKRRDGTMQGDYGAPLAGGRFTVNLGEHAEYGVSLDFRASRPQATIVVEDTTPTGQRVTGELSDRLTMYRLDIDFTYRIRALRYEYITPYVSAGVGAVWINSVSGRGLDKFNPVQNVHVSEDRAIGFGPNLAIGFDYKLSRNVSLFFEVRDHLTFTKFNQDVINDGKKFNSVEGVGGFIIHSSED